MELDKKLKELKTDDLEKLGAQFKDPAASKKRHDFHTHIVYGIAPPDVSKKTRILVLGGTHNIDHNMIEDSSILSDTYAIMHILEGAGSKTTVLMSNDCKPKLILDELLPDYEPGLLFGDSTSFTPRKVVLDRSMLGTEKFKNMQKNIQYCNPNQLKSKFLSLLEKEVKAARKDSLPLLVWLVGHGRSDDGAISIQNVPDNCKYITPEDVIEKLDQTVETCLVVAACYAGQWAVHNNINATVIAGSADDKQMMNLPASNSLDRSGGSSFVAALTDLLTRGPTEYRLSGSAVEIVSPQLSEDEKPTFARFVSDLNRALLYTDITSAQHGLMFSAQHDDYEANYSLRTGIPYAHFLQNLDKLKDYPNKPGASEVSVHALDRGATIPEIERSCFQDVRRTTGNNEAAVKACFVRESKDYLKYFTGEERLPVNEKFHRQLNRILAKENKDMDIGEVERLGAKVRYRLDVRARATMILMYAEVPLPYGLRCHEWTDSMETEFKKDVQKLHPSDGDSELHERIVAVWKGVLNANCLLHATKEQGDSWREPPAEYIRAALLLANYTDAELEAKLELIKQQAEERLKRFGKIVRNDENVKTSGSTLMNKVTSRMRALSPKKGKHRVSLSINTEGGALAASPGSFSPTSPTSATSPTSPTSPSWPTSPRLGLGPRLSRRVSEIGSSVLDTIRGRSTSPAKRLSSSGASPTERLSVELPSRTFTEILAAHGNPLDAAGPSLQGPSSQAPTQAEEDEKKAEEEKKKAEEDKKKRAEEAAEKTEEE